MNTNEKMTEYLVHSRVYQTPAEKVLQSRQNFYLSQKKNTESIPEWLWRIRDCVISCEFGEFNDFLLIDKFMSELRSDEIQNFKNVRTWILDQLCAAVNRKHPENSTAESSNDHNTSVNDILKVELDVVSFEK